MSSDTSTGRIKTREAALLFIYQSYYRKEDYLTQLQIFRENPEYNEILDNDIDYFMLLTKGIIDNRESIDSEYSPFLKNWKLERLPVLDRIILEIAVYEIKNIEEIHTSVSINEAVKLAKKYGNDNSSSYINGVLSNYEKSL
ncbi:MAG: transcription antitermination factor NusB [Clostridiales bacterium]|nr:transcription antitermination factor NusB [Clostridiales bacterium]